MPTIAYEVTAQVRTDLAPRYESYLREKHIRDVLATGAFLTATLERAGDRFRVRYIAHSREAVEAYVSRHAPRLRGDVTAHFPDGVALSREEWMPVESFQAGTSNAP